MWGAHGRKNAMDTSAIYSHLQAACRALEDTGDHAIAAHVGHAMAMVTRKYGIGRDHLEGCDD